MRTDPNFNNEKKFTTSTSLSYVFSLYNFLHYNFSSTLVFASEDSSNFNLPEQKRVHLTSTYNSDRWKTSLRHTPPPVLKPPRQVTLHTGAALSLTRDAIFN